MRLRRSIASLLPCLLLATACAGWGSSSTKPLTQKTLIAAAKAHGFATMVAYQYPNLGCPQLTRLARTTNTATDGEAALSPLRLPGNVGRDGATIAIAPSASLAAGCAKTLHANPNGKGGGPHTWTPVTATIVASPFAPDPKPKTVPAVRLDKEYLIFASDGRLFLLGRAYNRQDADAVLRSFQATGSALGQ